MPLNNADRREIKRMMDANASMLVRVIDDRFKTLHRAMRSNLDALEEGIEIMDDLVRRASEVAERSNTVAASFEAWWNEVKGRLENAVSQDDMNAVRSALETIDQNSSKFAQAIAANTAASGEASGGGQPSS